MGIQTIYVTDSPYENRGLRQAESWIDYMPIVLRELQSQVAELVEWVLHDLKAVGLIPT